MSCSVQLAELRALTEACKLAKGKAANIYTDSAYAHGVCFLFGALWKQRGCNNNNCMQQQQYPGRIDRL